jgi:hypothetical protein
VLLRFMAATGVDAHWLLYGEGQKYSTADEVASGRPSVPCISSNAEAMVLRIDAGTACLR